MDTHYWCHLCARTVQNPAEIRCPYCNTGFVEELEPEDLQLLLMLARPDHLMEEAQQPGANASRSAGHHVLLLDQSNGMVYLHRPPVEQQQQLEGIELLLSMLVEGGGVQGTPPAQKQAIEELPTVAAKGGENCVVCLDEMEAGSEAKEMPCRHRFHADCLLPWLQIHGTCPVCRLELKVGASSSGGGSTAEVVHGRRRHRFSSWLAALFLRRRSARSGGSSPPPET